jgi:hypothetical protein
MPVDKEAYCYSLLIDIIKKDYAELHHNVKDNRIWNPYTQLPPEIKSIIKINGLDYQYTIDIRSCYPSLFGEYVIKRIYYSIPTPIPAHIAYGNLDILMELKKYNDLFLNPDVNIKSHLSTLLDINKSEIKEVLIKYYNGHRVGKNINNPYNKYDAWLKSEFPLMYSLWKTTDIKQTGNNIGKYFETKLMLDQSIYNKAKDLGIIIGYEYDGMSFYSKDDSKCDILLDYIKSKSIELLGIQLVFVVKHNTWDIASMAQENNNRIEEIKHKEWIKTCKHTFSNLKRGIKVNWDIFYEKRYEYDPNAYIPAWQQLRLYYQNIQRNKSKCQLVKNESVKETVKICGIDDKLNDLEMKNDPEAIINELSYALEKWKDIISNEIYKKREKHIYDNMNRLQYIWQARNIIKEASSLR